MKLDVHDFIRKEYDQCLAQLLNTNYTNVMNLTPTLLYLHMSPIAINLSETLFFFLIRKSLL